MSKSYAQVLKQIEVLQAEADKIKRKETDGVIARIREAIDAYGLTAADLGLSGARRGRPSTRGKGKATRSKSKSSAPVRYRDQDGNTWVGRGPRPLWLRNALAGGKKLEDFAV